MSNLREALKRTAERCAAGIRQAALKVAEWNNLYQRIQQLKGEGKSQRSIALELSIDRTTASRFYQATEFPERAIGRRGGQATPFLYEIAKLWGEGCHNAQTLTTKVAALGYHGSYDSIRRLVARWRDPLSKPGEQDKASARARAIPVHSASRVAWLLFLNPQDLEEADERLSQSIQEHCPELREATNLAREFVQIVKGR